MTTKAQQVGYKEKNSLEHVSGTAQKMAVPETLHFYRWIAGK